MEAKLATKPSLTGSVKEHQKEARESETTVSYGTVEQHHLVFNEVRIVLEEVIKGQNLSQIYILIDEWTAVPAASQPYLAEYIKRCFLTSQHVSVKIASLEYRSEFSLRTEKNNVIGFELGADISAGLDLDDYCVFDRNPKGVTENFKILLYRHLLTELPDDYLSDRCHIIHQGMLTTALFSAAKTFTELVRAAEGVARDFINIFSKAFFDAHRRGRSKIDMPGVNESAREWYEQDKLPPLDMVQQKVLSGIMSNVIGEKRARSFMIERIGANHPVIQSLFDFRVIHLIRKGYADKSNPGLRYNIYKLDYGTYVDLLKTKQTPELEFIELDDSDRDPDRIVPFDDKRSIRRIILTEDQLQRWTSLATPAP